MPEITNFQTIADALDQMDKKSSKTVVEITSRMDDLAKQMEKGQTIVNEWGELTQTIKQHTEDLAAFNTLAENLQKQIKKKDVAEKSSAFNDVIENLVKDNHDKIVAGKGGSVLKFDNEDYSFQKDMSFTGNTTGMVVAPDFDRNIYGPPFQIPHIRNFVRIGRTSSNAYYYIVATLKSGAPASVAVGGEKPEMQYQFDGKIANVIKLAAHMRVPEEMLDDMEGLTTFLQNYAPEEVLKTEDTEILTGNNTTGHFNGIITQAPVHVPSTGVSASEPWDLIANAIAQLQIKWFPPNRGMVNPIDWFFMATRKSTDGVYSIPTLITGAPLVVAGMPITPHPKITQDQYVIGDFTKAELKVKSGISLRFYEQDRDNPIKNMVTIVVEERAAFVVYFPDAFLKGDFGNLS